LHDCRHLHLFSVDLQSDAALGLIFRGVKGGVAPLFADLPAVNVKSVSAVAGEGATWFDFGMVVEGIAEWNDMNGDGIVTVNELVADNLFVFNNNGYSWTFSPSHANGLWSVVLSGSGTSLPSLEVNCSFPDHNGLALGAQILNANELKCDVDVTNLALKTLTNNWAMRFFLVTGTKNVMISTAPSQPSGSGATAGATFDIGLGGSFSWVGKAGHIRGRTDVNVTFSGNTAAGASWTGTGALDASNVFFGFVNPNPGSQFDAIYWDPTVTAPSASDAFGVAPSLLVVALATVMAWLRA